MILRSTTYRRKAAFLHQSTSVKPVVRNLRQTSALTQLDVFLKKIGVIADVSTPQEFKKLVGQLHKVVMKKSAQVDFLKQYRKFVYTTACNVPKSVHEEGTVNKAIAKTSTK